MSSPQPLSYTFRLSHLLKILEAFENKQLPLDQTLNDYFRKHKALGSKDRSFIYETIYSLIRWKLLYSWFIPKPFSWENALTYSMQNAVAPLQNTPDLPLYIKFSTDEWLFDLLVKEYGVEKACEICTINNTQAPATIRVNTLKMSRDDLYNQLSLLHDVEKQRDQHRASLFLKGSTSLRCLSLSMEVLKFKMKAVSC